MRKANLKDIPEQERKSPKGKFGRFTKNISIALGRQAESLDLSKRHPFDLAMVRIPKGKAFARITRTRLNQSFTSSSPVVATCVIMLGLSKSDRVMHFSFSQVKRISLSNAGDEDFVYYVIADNPRSGGSDR